MKLLRHLGRCRDNQDDNDLYRPEMHTLWHEGVFGEFSCRHDACIHNEMSLAVIKHGEGTGTILYNIDHSLS